MFQTLASFTVSGLDIVSAAITSIKGATSMVVSIITPTISFPVGEFTNLSTFTNVTVCGINIVSTAITTIKVTCRVVVHVITEVITNPAVNTASSATGSIGSICGFLEYFFFLDYY